MTPQVCSRHPSASHVEGNCAACLLADALPTTATDASSVVSGFTVQVPLGHSDAATVFLARIDTPLPRLLRLKRWRAQAPPAFVERFQALTQQLEQWRPSEIVMPVRAWVDAAGCPSVLTEFRQGIPLLQAVSSRRLSSELAITTVRRLREVLRAAHARGLIHGSVVAGNVLTSKPDVAPYLLDFWFAALVNGAVMSPEDDWRGLATIEADVRARTSPSGGLSA